MTGAAATIELRNLKRYAICVLPSAALLTLLAYGPFGLIVAAMNIPGALVCVAFVGLIPAATPRAIGRTLSIAVCALLSYVAIAGLQALLDRTGTIDYWSPAWAVTFLAGLTGVAFGCVAILPTGRRDVRQSLH